MKKFMPTELQQTYLLGMDSSTFLGGNCPFIYIETKIKNFDTQKFNNALYAVINNNTLLHSTLNDNNEWEDNREDVEIKYINGTENTADDICRESIEKCKKFRLKVYVDKKDNKTAKVHFKFSELIIDGMSINIFLAQLKKAYLGKELPKTEDFSDYVKRLDEYSESNQYKEDTEKIKSAYKNKEYDDFSMPLKSDPFSLHNTHNACVCLPIGKDLFNRAESLAQSLGTSVFSLLLTIYSKVISRFSGAQKFALNIPCSARFRDMNNIDDTIGLFSNYVNVPIDINPDISVAELAKITGNQINTVNAARFISGNETTNLMDLPSANYSKNITFTMLPFVYSNDDDSFTVNNWRIVTNQTMLETHILTQNGIPAISINYPNELFDKLVVSDIAEMFVTALKETVETNGALITLSLPKKTQEIINKVNGTVIPKPTKTLTEVLLDAFYKYSNNPLCIFHEKEYTYSEIHRMAMALGKRIGNNPGNVMLLLPKSVEQFVSAYAVLLVGGAYMPTDISYTVADIDYCLKKTNTKTIITTASLINKIPKDYTGNVIIAEGTDWNNIDGFLPAKTNIDDACILINTSGTTGRPKSVILHHKGLANCLGYTPSFNKAKEGDKIIALTNYCHDMAIFDFIGIFFFGGCVVIPDEQQAKEPSQWIDFIKRYNVSLWESVPSFIEMLMMYIKAENINEKYPQLKCIKLGGEHLKPSTAEFVFNTFPNTLLYNVGGPSETTIWNINHLVTSDDLKKETIPYGAPIPNNSYNVFNSNYEDCPCGVAGIMFCSGIGVSKGYLGNPEETALKFIEKDGTLYYNTGDIGVRQRNGDLVILGRNDFQVKIHGKRIELSGIESILEQNADILGASVIYIHKLGKIAALYISSKDISSSELYEYMKSKLADYMIPSVFVRATSIPLTRNGKPNRKEIEKIIIDNIENNPQKLKEKNISESNELKNQIIEIFEDELDCDIDDNVNFYEIGGDSLSAVKISAKLRQLVDKNVSVFDMVNSQTVMDFIDAII